eukprot:308150-Ditylum_brightwellii.AAC.1
MHLEIKTMEAELHTNIARVLRFALQAFLMLHQDPSNVDQYLSAYLCNYRHDIMFHIISTNGKFNNAYKCAHNLQEFPSLNVNVQAAIATAECIQQEHKSNAELLVGHLYGTQQDKPPLQQQYAPPPPVFDTHYTAIKAFKTVAKAKSIDTWTRYLDQINQIDIDLALKNLSTTKLTIDATEASQMEIDGEASISCQHLSDLIKQQTEAELPTKGHAAATKCLIQKEICSPQLIIHLLVKICFPLQQQRKQEKSTCPKSHWCRQYQQRKQQLWQAEQEQKEIWHQSQQITHRFKEAEAAIIRK